MTLPAVDPQAGQVGAPEARTNIPRLLTAYYSLTPDPGLRPQRVAFGTSGHRGSSLLASFNEQHILAISQAIAEHRLAAGITGPLYLGIDTHALSESAAATALEVLVANGVDVRVDAEAGYVPTPVISHAILTHNAGRPRHRADGIVVTPSHNPPEDGGFKYNPPHGGPAGTEITRAIQDRANALLADGVHSIRRIGWRQAMESAHTTRHDFREAYITDLAGAIDFDAIRAADVRLGVDPMGGAGVTYWGAIADRYGIPLEVVSRDVDPTFGFMPRDWDGKIRMDCSSPWAMQRLIALQDRFDVAWASDPDHDRHGIVTRSGGLMPPNAYLATAIGYLGRHRPDWAAGAGIGKTVVSSAIIDRVAAELGRPLHEVPVGFKWFVDGLLDGSLAFGGEESAGASFVRRNGSVWTTDKDGLLLGLLAAEMTAVTGRDPAEQHRDLTARLGDTWYARIDAAATPAQQAALGALTPANVTARSLAGSPITARLTTAPGNDAPIGGLKVVSSEGWFAARPSGTERVYKLYAESFVGPEHLRRIQDEAREILAAAIASD
ncbi:MAG: phosphoglucomutase (alpha-D-glucose-1,6-bisphosphate-dependent) [Gemmatimonadota bacterium]